MTFVLSVLLPALGAFLVAIFVTAVVTFIVTGQWPCREVMRARARRQARFQQYVVEYLNYGYDERDARMRADARMSLEAQEAERLIP